MKKFFIGLLVVVFVGLGIYKCSLSWASGKIIDAVKNGYFDEELPPVTIGAVMKSVCTHSKWTYTPDTESGISFVTYTGKRNGRPLKMVFYVTNFGGQIVYRINSLTVNGQDVPPEKAPYVIFSTYLKNKK